MMNKWQKVGLAASTAVLSLGIVTAKPVQATSFLFDFDGRGQGSLSFTNTPLTGLTGFGEESISIDDLYNLAEDVNFQFSYPTTVQTPLGGYEDADYGENSSGEIFKFFNGQLIGINLTSTFSVSYDFYGGSRGGSVSESKTLFVRDDRFTTLFNSSSSSGGFNYCDGTSYYDEATGQFYDASVCYSDEYLTEYTDQVEEEGIRDQGRSLQIDIFEYYVEALDNSFREVNETILSSYSSFTRFDELPQITFTTLEPITPSEPIPEPLTLLGTGTAIAFGLSFKKVKQRKKK